MADLVGVLARSPDPIVVTDAATRVLAIHAGTSGVHLPAPGDLLIDAFAQARPAAALACEQAALRGTAGRLDVTFATADGDVAWFQTTLVPLPAALDDADAVLWMFADVTQRRREEAQLRLRASMMTDTAGVAHLGTWEWDPAEPHAIWSPELHRIYGTDPAIHVPTYPDYLTRVHPDDRERVRLATEAVFNDHSPYSHDERILRPDGSIRWLHTWARAVTDKDGRLARLIGVCQDITERKEAELEIAERLREKEVLLKEVHHRVKNNLQVVASLLNMQSHAAMDKRLRASLQEARDRVRAMALAHETLYSAGVLSRIDLSEYVRRLARDVFRSHELDPDRVTLEVQGEPTPLGMERAINAGLVLNELLTNAIKHAFPAGRAGTIRIDVRPMDGGVRVSVEDDGVGMREDLQDAPRGVGLRLVDALVRQMGGSIEWTQDGGTKATVTLRAQREGGA